ncbi:MAG: hypothetical protein DMG50_01340 [Acidobacteria bacterium]|nr:MAG: hypothetical protein DMG50_01340 [Acidobacteriota bacterium]
MKWTEDGLKFRLPELSCNRAFAFRYESHAVSHCLLTQVLSQCGESLARAAVFRRHETNTHLKKLFYFVVGKTHVGSVRSWLSIDFAKLPR